MIRPAWGLPAAIAVAIAWLLLFELNRWLFASIERTSFVTWVFLPAALRMVAVLVFGWSGALGLFVGASVTNAELWPQDWQDALVLSLLSALPVYAACELVRRWLVLPGSLSGMRARHLLWFSLVGALASAACHNLYFSATSRSMHMLEHFLPMLAGDMLGMFIMLYAASRLLARLPRR